MRIEGFRSVRSLSFAPGPVCALVGGPSVGKSNVLAAVWLLLHGGAPDPGAGDLPVDDGSAVRLGASLVGGGEITLQASPPDPAVRRGPAVRAVLLPASERSGRLVADPPAEPFPVVVDPSSAA